MVTPNPWQNSTVVGKADLSAMLRRCVEALDGAELHGARAALERRLFDRPSNELFDMTLLADGVWACQFKPMAELVLLEVLSVAAAAPRMGREDAERQIEQALTLAGF